jgi:hypothetical protein
MSEVTDFVALPFVLADDGLAPGEAVLRTYCDRTFTCAPSRKVTIPSSI